MFERITGYFNKLKQEKEDRKNFAADMETIQAAMKRGDAAEVATVFERMNASPQMGRAYNVLLQNAIATDNEAIFKTVFSRTMNADYKITEYDDFLEGPMFYTEKGILYAAIENGASKIALSLARNPAVSVSDSGYHETSRYSGGKTTRERDEYPSPLDAAEKKGMTKVAAVIADRMSQAYAQRAIKARATQPA